GDLGGEGAQLVDHAVDGVLEVEDLAADVDADLARKIAGGDGLGDVGDVPNLRRQVAGHRVDVVGEVLPGAGDLLDVGLTAELALGADFARDARDLGGEGPELVDHAVHGVLELGALSADVDGDLACELSLHDALPNFGDVPNLRRQVAGHRVDGVAEVLPGAGHATYVGLAAELTLGADFAGDARHLRGERADLIDHRVDGVLELQDLAADIHRDLLGQVTIGDGGGDLGDVADLCGEVAGHRVDGVGEVLPGAGHVAHVGLATELALGADLAGDARDLGGERAELVDHRVDGVLELEHLAVDLDGDLSRKIAVGDGGGDLGDVADLGRQVAGHGVVGSASCRQSAGHAVDAGLAAKLAPCADLAGDARDFGGEGAELIDHRVDGVLELEHLAANVDGDLSRKIAVGDSGGDLGDVADLGRQVAGHG